jgi:hypothetical protein
MDAHDAHQNDDDNVFPARGQAPTGRIAFRPSGLMLWVVEVSTAEASGDCGDSLSSPQHASPRKRCQVSGPKPATNEPGWRLDLESIE